MTKIFIHKQSEVSEFESECPVQFLMNHFGKWESSNSVYRDSINSENKIPLTTVDEVRDFATTKFEVLHVVVYPKLLAAIGIGLIALTGAALLFGKKSKKETASRKTPGVGSPNNGLSARENTERISERVPDIYGKVRSVPDLITPPYIVYQNNTEVEYGLSVIGRGQYDVTDVRDGETLIANIAGSAVQVFAPGNYPSTPQLTVGTAISETIVAVKKNNNVEGQILLAPNATHVSSSSRFKFYPTGLIEVDNSVDPDEQSDIEFDAFFAVGDVFVISGTYTLNGTYEVTAVDAASVTLLNPATINANWSSLPGGGAMQASTVHFTTSSDKTVGPFIVEGASNLYCNFVAEEGLYKDNNEAQFATSVTIRVTTRAVDESDVPFGAETSQDITLRGSSQSRGRVAVTLKGGWNYTNKRFRVSAKRLSNKDFAYEGQVSDEVKWESLSGVSSIDASKFSEVTVVKSSTRANSASLSLKARKLNMLVTRKIPMRDGGGTFGSPTATSNFADIIVAICKDPKIGNRVDAEIDFTSIYATRTEVSNYFGTAKACEFNYTFDDSNLSFEEIVTMVAEAVFCSIYRQGNLIKMLFEKSTSPSRLLFNHRNKIPGSEKRTVSFGNFNDKDGVEVSYVDNTDGATLTYYIPEDQSAVNPEVVEIAGLTNKLQAYFHAHRAWGKARFKNTICEFEATQEANLLVRGEKILVADNTRAETWDGEVIAKTGFTLTLSQNFEFEVGETYSIFLQLADATIQSIAITPGTMSNEVVLATNPSMALAIGDSLYASCVYEIVKNAFPRKRIFVIENKEPVTNFNSVVTAYNYDERYYEKDTDYIDEVVDLNGNLL